MLMRRNDDYLEWYTDLSICVILIKSTVAPQAKYICDIIIMSGQMGLSVNMHLILSRFKKPRQHGLNLYTNAAAGCDANL